MVPRELRESLREMIAGAEHPRELAIDVMFALQDHYGYLSDEAVAEAAERAARNDAAGYVLSLKEPIPLGTRAVVRLRLGLDRVPHGCTRCRYGGERRGSRGRAQDPSPCACHPVAPG